MSWHASCNIGLAIRRRCSLTSWGFRVTGPRWCKEAWFTPSYFCMPRPGNVGLVYRELQFGLRAAVGTRTLDELLEDKATIDTIVKEFAAQKLMAAGITLEGVGVKDIILPGEMKTILAQVVEAEKSAQANVIRRCEETAATRSLLNTAKLMEDNPIALRMKELETLERVAERIDKISVFGGLDSVLNGLVKLR